VTDQRDTEQTAGRLPGRASGVLALVGGGEWQPGTEYDADLLEHSGADEVRATHRRGHISIRPGGGDSREVVLVARSRARGLMVLRHADATRRPTRAAVREARFIYLSGGSPSTCLVLKGSLVFEALAAALSAGAVVAARRPGRWLLVDPMVDPRGGRSPSD